jgi:hypothetical protein
MRDPAGQQLLPFVPPRERVEPPPEKTKEAIHRIGRLLMQVLSVVEGAKSPQKGGDHHESRS